MPAWLQLNVFMILVVEHRDDLIEDSSFRLAFVFQRLHCFDFYMISFASFRQILFLCWFLLDLFLRFMDGDMF